jgi:hypothetical protein
MFGGLFIHLMRQQGSGRGEWFLTVSLDSHGGAKEFLGSWPEGNCPNYQKISNKDYFFQN